jgi:8-hydroxy-5-deazaflavin:NADPH oxidoreductase
MFPQREVYKTIAQSIIHPVSNRRLETVTRSSRAPLRTMSRKIAIVGGTGPEGMGLALRWARAGEAIVIGSREAQRAEETARQIASRSGGTTNVRGSENSEAVAGADVVVLTIPFAGHAALLKKLKPAFRPGAIVIDTAVPLAAAVGGLPTRTLGVWQGSAAEEAAEIVPKEVSVAAAFQNISAGLLNSEDSVDCDVIICTDDERARQVVSELAEKIPGVRAVNGGRLENARIVEQLTALLVTINQKHKVHSAGLRVTGLPLPLPRR